MEISFSFGTGALILGCTALLYFGLIVVSLEIMRLRHDLKK